MRLLRAFWDAARAVDPEGAGPLDEGMKMGYAQPAALGELWSEAGLADVDVSELVVEVPYDDFDDLWSPFLGRHRTGRLVRGGARPRDRQERLRERLRAELGDPDGPFTLTARAWHAGGTRAAS